MKVMMKRFEKLAVDFVKQYKSWELQAAGKDCYLSGYKQAVEDIKETGDYIDYDMYEGWSNFSYNTDVGEELIEVEFPDGSHQLIDDISTKRTRLSPAPLTKEEEQTLKELQESEELK